MVSRETGNANVYVPVKNMAKKRKSTNKGSKQSYQNLDDDYVPTGKGKQECLGREGTRSSARKKAQKRKGKNTHNPSADDAQLRNSIEADGALTIVDMNAAEKTVIFRLNGKGIQNDAN